MAFWSELDLHGRRARIDRIAVKLIDDRISKVADAIIG